MAKYSITAPDGTKFKITAPDDATEAEVMAYAKQKFAEMKPVKAAPSVSPIESALRGVGHGLSMGWMDEIAGAAKAPFRPEKSWSDAYAAGRNETRAANKAAHDANPGMYLGGELGGAVLPMFIPGVGAVKGVQGAATLGGKMLAGGKAGARVGAVSGLGNAEGGAGQQLWDTAKGGMIGAGVGAILPPVLAGGSMLLSKPLNAIRNLTAPKQRSAEILADRFAMDNGGKLPSASDLAAKLPDTAVKDSMLVDAGGANVRRLSRAWADRPNTQRQQYLDKLDDRAANQWREIERAMSKNYADPAEHANVLGSLQAFRKSLSPQYREAFAAPDFVPSDRLMALFERGIDKETGAQSNKMARPIMEEIRKSLQKRLDNLNGVESDLATEVANSPLQHLHNVKTHMDDFLNVLEARIEAGTAKNGDKTAWRDITALKRELMKGIEESQGAGVKKYLDLNKTFSGSSAMERAMKAGQKDVGKLQGDELAAKMAELTPGEQQMYRMGAVRSWNAKNKAGPELNDRLKPQWSTPARQEQMQVLAPNKAANEDMQSTLDTLQRQFETRKAAAGNSDTSAKLYEQKMADKPQELATDLAQNLIRGKVGKALESAWNGVTWFGENNPRVAAEGLKLMSEPVSRGYVLRPEIEKAFAQQLAYKNFLDQMAKTGTRAGVNLSVPLAISGPDPTDPTSAFPNMAR